MTDKAQVTREELMAMREVARKAWEAARRAPSRWGTEAAEFAAWADREMPLPAPEPQQVTGPSGESWRLRIDGLMVPGYGCLERTDPPGSPWGSGPYELGISLKDRATVANLLVPFEDVVRATLEEMKVEEVQCRGVGYDPGSQADWLGLRQDFRAKLPAILKRLGAR